MTLPSTQRTGKRAFSLFHSLTKVLSIKGIRYVFLHLPLNVDHNNNTLISVFIKQFSLFPGLNLLRGVHFSAWEKGDGDTKRAESSTDFLSF